MTITASHAQPGDVVLDRKGTEWKRGGDSRTWFTFEGLVTHEGPWKARFGPQGDLDLLVRDGKRVP